MANSSAEKIIILKSSEGEEFKVDKKVAMMIPMIQHAIEDNTANNPVIQIPNVSTNTLSLVLEYCTKHATETKTTDNGPAVPTASMMSDEELKEWDKNFIDLDPSTLFDISNAAYFIGLHGLVELVFTKLANIVSGKNVEEIRSILNIKNDFTPEEEEQIRQDNPWAFNL